MTVKLLNNVISEVLPTAIPLNKTNIAKALGKDKLARLQAVLETTPNKRYAYFWTKYAHIASVGKTNTECGGFVAQFCTQINFNLDHCEGENFSVLIHETTHAIDHALSNGSYKHAKKTWYTLASNLPFAGFETDGELINLFDAIARDRAELNAACKASGYSKEVFKESLENYASHLLDENHEKVRCKYSLPLMVLNNNQKFNEFFAEFVSIAISQPELFSELVKVIPATAKFFETLITYLTPEYSEKIAYSVNAKFKINAKGKLIINFNHKYTAAQMLDRLQKYGGLTLNAAYSVLMQAVKFGKAQSSGVEIETVADLNLALRKLRQTATDIAIERQAA